MTPEQKDLVQATFRKVQPIADTAATIFYDKLFVLDPDLRRLFPDDMTDQRAKLMATLGFAISNLKTWGDVSPQVRQLAIRHLDYGVKEEHYQIVGSALIDTLAVGLKEEFTPQVKDAWLACYGFIAGEMKQVAYHNA